jgi:NAD(P)-dependent dehydrogenase (short-subunit alcohol dehydrogenase family)
MLTQAQGGRVMTRRLEGKVALVTGAGSGIGKASALAFAREGARVVVSDVDAEGGEETTRLAKSAGGQAAFIGCDVSRASEVESLIKKAVEVFDRLDCAHNNAGIAGTSAPCADCTEENWDLTLGINLKGVWLCMKHEIRHMAKHGGGVIVNTAATAGLVGAKGSPAYAAASHGVVGLTRSAALEYADAGIRVNAVCPGVTRTPMIERLTRARPGIEEQMIAKVPMRRLATPEEVAETVVWLCSDGASFITGQALAVDGGVVAS